MSAGFKQSEKAARREQQDRAKALLEGRVAYIAMALQSFWDLPWYLRLWWTLTGRFDAARSLKAYQAAQRKETDGQ